MSENKKKIVALIVTYNRLDFLKKCLVCLFNQTWNDFGIIIIDNDSSDGTGEYIQAIEYTQRLKYYNTRKNIGGAGGFQFGLKIAVNLGYQSAWIMDDDTMPDSHALEYLVHADDSLNGDYGFLSSYVKWKDGSACKMNIPEISQEIFSDLDFAINSKYLRINSASFVSCYLNLEVVRKVGLPIKEFFIWGDDSEYTQRISNSQDCWLIYDSQVVHEMKLNQNVLSILDPSLVRIDRYYYQYRNQLYIRKKKDC